MAVEQQILIIYAATKGYLDDVALDNVAAWEDGFHRYMLANQHLVATTVNSRRRRPPRKLLAIHDQRLMQATRLPQVA